jgi:MinD-like ATPase involved in chromosome partitioning or flagellar assembly
VIPECGDDLLVRRRTRPAATGWRHIVHRLTAGVVNPGISAKERAYRQRIAAITTPLNGYHKIAVCTFKGGTGKTTVTAALGSTLAAHRRGDRVVALDANPAAGDLVNRICARPDKTVADLASAGQAPQFADMRCFTGQNSAGLEVLASYISPREAYQFSSEVYVTAMGVLQRHYSVMLVDCGTDMTTALFTQIADDVGALIVVAAETVQGVDRAALSLHWLRARGYTPLLAHTVLATNAIRPGRPNIDMDKAVAHLKERSGDRPVVRIPYDPHLAEGEAVDLKLCAAKTRDAFLDLAVACAADFPVRADADRHRARFR